MDVSLKSAMVGDNYINSDNYRLARLTAWAPADGQMLTDYVITVTDRSGMAVWHIELGDGFIEEALTKFDRTVAILRSNYDRTGTAITA